MEHVPYILYKINANINYYSSFKWETNALISHRCHTMENLQLCLKAADVRIAVINGRFFRIHDTVTKWWRHQNSAYAYSSALRLVWTNFFLDIQIPVYSWENKLQPQKYLKSKMFVNVVDFYRILNITAKKFKHNQYNKIKILQFDSKTKQSKMKQNSKTTCYI